MNGYEEAPRERGFLSDMEGHDFDEKTVRRFGTFADNKKLPVHRWFNYSAGFSAEWVQSLLNQRREATVLDPFMGSGTVNVTADSLGIASYGVEAHSFVYKMAQGKSLWPSSTDDLLDAYNRLLPSATDKEAPYEEPPRDSLLYRCYTEEALTALLKLKHAWRSLTCQKTAKALLFTALSSILRETSYVGTAQCQCVLPKKRKANVLPVPAALMACVQNMLVDMKVFQGLARAKPLAKLINGDSRELSAIPDSSIDIVITSPPYANNYDYSDATRLELTFWDEISSWKDLHGAIRKNLICSNTQHASHERFEIGDLLRSEWLSPIKNEITAVCDELGQVRLTKGGKKPYHTMIAAYFIDMAKCLRALRRVVKDGGEMYIVIGDSAPYGVYAPIDIWLGRLAVAQEFKDFDFTKFRDRNVKWKNRKHRVPLKEGILHIKG